MTVVGRTRRVRLGARPACILSVSHQRHPLHSQRVEQQETRPEGGEFTLTAVALACARQKDSILAIAAHETETQDMILVEKESSLDLSKVLPSQRGESFVH